MKDIIAAVKKSIADLRSKADVALKKLGPLDSLEVGREVLYGLNSLEWTVDSLKDISDQMDNIEAKLPKEAEVAAAALIDARIASGELVKKADIEIVAANAKKEGRDEAALEFAEEKRELHAVAARRTELTEAHGAEVVATLSESAFAGDDAAFTASKTEIGRRVTVLAELGVDPVEKKNSYTDLVSLSLDDAGSASFDGRVAQIKDLAPRKTGTIAATRQTPDNRQPPITAPARSETLVRPTYGF